MNTLNNWIKIEQQPLPDEEFILVKHDGKIEAIHCFNGIFRYWYTNSVVDEIKLQRITEWLNPKNVK